MKGLNAILAIIWLNSILVGCSTNTQQSESQIKDEIQNQLDKCVKAVETKDIGLYMDLIPEDFVIYDESGETISRDKQREYTLRDWSIIDRTLSNKYIADSIKITGDSVIVFTSQRWERLMFQRDGKTTDTVLTTQKHVETWGKKKVGLTMTLKSLADKFLLMARNIRIETNLKYTL